jgi:hypothetical protein
MIRNYCSILLPILLFSLSSFTKQDKPTDYKEYSYNFVSGIQGWDSLFSDYPKGEESLY